MQHNHSWSATSSRGIDILNSSNLNKGIAFTKKERKDFGLVGLLPEGVETLDGKLERVRRHLEHFYMFPTVGLAVYVTRPKRITDEVFIVAAQASADQVSQEQRDHGMLFPSQANILEVEVAIATRTAAFMFDSGLATVQRLADIRHWIEEQLYDPQY
jgi:hypothetical protein